MKNLLYSILAVIIGFILSVMFIYNKHEKQIDFVKVNGVITGVNHGFEDGTILVLDEYGSYREATHEYLDYCDSVGLVMGDSIKTIKLRKK